MEIVCSPKGLIDVRYPRQGIMDVAEAGFEQGVLDLSMCFMPASLEHAQISVDKFLKDANRLIEAFDRQGVKIAVAIAPHLKNAVKETQPNELLEQLTIESIRLCKKCGCKKIIVQPLFAGIDKEKLWQVNREYLLKLAQIGKKHGMQLLLENQCRDVNGHQMRGVCSDETETARWIDALNEAAGEPCFGFCLNVSVCNLCGQNMQEMIRVLGKRIGAAIISEGDGNSVNAMLPFTSVGKGHSRTDWLQLIRGLREIEYDGMLIFDFADTAAAFPPVLRPHLMKLAKAEADYFKMELRVEELLKKYPQRVLFGAGNLFRFYMSCYGEKYPPLFTCDNNEALWGKEICGVTVQSPEKLKELPKDCPIFICNLYYRDIRCQLQEMGIENPIEFIDGDYLPTFYYGNLADGGN